MFLLIDSSIRNKSPYTNLLRIIKTKAARHN